MTFVYTRRNNVLEKCLLFFKKAQKKGDFRKLVCFALFISPSNRYPKHANRGSVAQPQQQSLKQLFPLTWVNIWTGSHLQWRIKSLLPAAMQHGTHRPWALLLWRLPMTRELGKDRGLSSSNCLQLMLQAELAGFATENTSFLRISWCMILKSSKALHTRFLFLLFAWAFQICWGEEKTLDVWSWA